MEDTEALAVAWILMASGLINGVWPVAVMYIAMASTVGPVTEGRADRG